MLKLASPAARQLRMALLLLLKVAALWMAAMSSAQAYVDPGTGMLLLQGALAALGALVFFIRHPVRAIRSWLRVLRKKKP